MARLCWLSVELVVLFVCVPLMFRLRLLPNQPIAGLVVLAVGIFLWLQHMPGFDPKRLWNRAGMEAHLRRTLLRTAVLCITLGLMIYWTAPELLLRFPREQPRLWLLVMVLYPLISVYPQELIFRAFFCRRYRALFGNEFGVLLASATVFGFAHVVYGNWVSIWLSAAGGLLFGLSYLQSESLLLSAIEHAMYGNFLFTIGLGEFFYHGTAR